MVHSVSLVIFEGGAEDGQLEQDMRYARQGIVLDQLVKAQNAGFARIILCTPYDSLAQAAAMLDVPVEVVSTDITSPFHFGRLLRDVVREKQLERVLYMGGAAAPLLSSSELLYLAELLAQNENVVIANNYYSADIVGFNPGTALDRISLPDIDNVLALALVHEASLRLIPLQRSLGLSFDVDTPSDLLILAVHPDTGPYTREALASLDLDYARHDSIKTLLGDPHRELVLFGRIGAQLFDYLDNHTRCRIRLFSEERGMKALGRDRRGEVVSLVGRLIEALGYVGFFEFLAQFCHGAVLDTRVLFEHFGWKLSQADRFASDIGALDLISHPGLRDFTAAAFNASIPVLLGGHSLVTGGMWALIDAGNREQSYRG